MVDSLLQVHKTVTHVQRQSKEEESHQVNYQPHI